MSHAPDIDIEAESNRAVPPRFCKSKWKQVVAGCLAIALAVLGYSIHTHFLVAGPQVAQSGTGATRQVALVRPGAVVPAQGAVRLVGRRTAFNGAATAIRPTVLGVRVSLGPVANGVPVAERTGSAVVVDPRGYAVTCRHVVADAQRIKVRRFRQTGRWLPAHVVAVQGDLALLKTADSTPFPAATFADSSSVKVGDWVLAVGYPFGLGMTVTAGIVGRRHAALTLPGGQTYSDLLQTDAPINEGSSGGPLVNSAGQVVGLNAAIYAPTGVFAGAGFAIPGNRVRQFVQGVIGTAVAYSGRTRATWGFGLVQLTPDLASRLSYPRARGVMVDNVVRGSPAEAAQLARGDVVLAIGGQPVVDLAAARRLHEQLAGANSVSLQVWRHGARLTVVLHPSSIRG